MKKFFRGWRRKIGVVALVVAMMLLIGWFRSHLLGERIHWIVGDTESYISSDSGKLCVNCGQADPAHPQGISYRTRTLLFENPSWPEQGPEWIRLSGGFTMYKWSYGFDEFRVSGSDDTYFDVVIPCWSAIALFTLLSAYLLLSKPRVAKPKSTFQSV